MYNFKRSVFLVNTLNNISIKSQDIQGIYEGQIFYRILDFYITTLFSKYVQRQLNPDKYEYQRRLIWE